MLPLRLNRRFFTLLAVLMLCMSFLTITASAEANPPKDDVIIYTADPTEPKPTEAAPKPTTPKPTTPPETEPPVTTAPTTPTVKPVEPFTEGNAIAKDLQFHEIFNLNRPGDFTGHSLSVSDIVALKQDGVVSYHYCDSVGFKELPDFQKENYLNHYLTPPFGCAD